MLLRCILLCLQQKLSCKEVTGAYSAQNKEINISLPAIGLLWSATDFIAKGLGETSDITSIAEQNNYYGICEDVQDIRTTEANEPVPMKKLIDYKSLLFSVFTILGILQQMSGLRYGSINLNLRQGRRKCSTISHDQWYNNDVRLAGNV
ncbi:uncharacterized protein LOC121997482 isoform X4 [Zingiber officinale]|uniref:uncharacterized protein LOC121997482 isoform X4 n=1 Tax=Zingiber officinale TaxID=94328 RepID=UPI001C4CB0F6|nr:uncharacterized protein LOC121997482 isoform X4 [Zingiber officinale]XP_042407853.1 uncharacterized protein LOC121997482 isoform X4 [Zingiber officinale]